MTAFSAKLAGNIELDLDRFARNVAEKVLFSGVAASARVMYDEAKAQCPVSQDGHYFYGTSFKKTGKRYFFKAGTLRDSIYRVYSPEKSSDERKTYRISWNHTKAPYGFMVEFGTARAPAHPFIRPAFSLIHEALEAGKQRMAQRLLEPA